MARLINADTLIAWIKDSQQMTSKMKSIICYIKTMPTIDAVSVDEWCHDCKEYDKEKHSCPRFNRVIRTALKDADMVSVVRCKDCKWVCYCDTEDFETYVDCNCPDGGGVPRNEDWFCADGERKNHGKDNL